MSTTDIEFAVTIWNVGDESYTNPESFGRVATAAEEHGFDAVWAGEHPIIPENIPDEYPFTPDGEAPMDISHATYDVFDLLSWIAGMTDSINVGTNVAVIPYRHPILLVKNALTLHALSDGRFELGASPGWLRTEFEILDVPFEERGSRTDEFFRLYERVCEEGELAFDGPHHSFQKASFYPVPDEDELPSVWFGGKSGATVRRIGEFGDGWSIFWAKPDEVASMKDRIMNAWEDFGREGEPRIAVARPVKVGEDTDENADKPLVGSPETIAEDVEQYAEAGMTRLVMTTYDLSTEAQLEQIRRLGDEVIPRFR